MSRNALDRHSHRQNERRPVISEFPLRPLKPPEHQETGDKYLYMGLYIYNVMTKSYKAKELVEQFAEVGTSEPQVEINETVATMAAIFNAYPDSYFTQRDFVTRLNKSNPFINHQLHKLLSGNIIERIGTRRKYFYRLAQKS